MSPGILITGAAGFVGAHTAQRFVRDGWAVTGYDLRPADERLWPTYGDQSFVVGDLLNRANLRDACVTAGVTGIVHCAGVVGGPAAHGSPERAVEVNVGGTMNVLGVAEELGLRVTYLSTASIYGDSSSLRPLGEDDPVLPVGFYEVTKYMGELLANSCHHASGVDVVSLRPSFVYGPGSSIGDYFVLDAVGGKPVERPGGRDHPCEFTAVWDLAEAIFLAHTVRPVPHRLFNVSSGEYRTRGELADIVKRCVPGADVTIGEGVDPARNLRAPMDLSRLRGEVGYAPRYTLEAGIGAWVDWLRDPGNDRVDTAAP
jgi:UDP-glucuronate 4-epimerase